MAVGRARPQAAVDVWGGRAWLPQEGTSENRMCQRRQPSTSTYGLRVGAGNRTLRHRYVDVVRTAGRWERQGGKDASHDGDLQLQVDRSPEAQFGAVAEAEAELPVVDPGPRHTVREAGCDERPQGPCDRAGFVRQERADLDVETGRQPDSRGRPEGAAIDGGDHAAAGGDEPGRRAAPEHSHRLLG